MAFILFVFFHLLQLTSCKWTNAIVYSRSIQFLDRYSISRSKRDVFFLVLVFVNEIVHVCASITSLVHPIPVQFSSKFKRKRLFFQTFHRSQRPRFDLVKLHQTRIGLQVAPQSIRSMYSHLKHCHIDRIWYTLSTGTVV